MELESKGASGANFSFSQAEKESAATMIMNNFGTFTGVFGSKNRSGDISSSSQVGREHIDQIVNNTEKYYDDLIASGIPKTELDSILLRARTFDRSSESNNGSIKNILILFASAFAKAEGNVVAGGLGQLVSSALSFLPH